MNRNLLILTLILFVETVTAQSPLIKQWDKRYGGISLDLTQDFIYTTDGGYLIGGYVGSDSSGDISENSYGAHDFWIVKTNDQGNKLWDKRYGGNNDDALYSMQQTPDGGFILGGFSLSDSSGIKSSPLKGYLDFWVVKIDSSGTKLWDKSYGGTTAGYYIFKCVKATPDGGYIALGHTPSPIGGDNTHGNWDTTLVSYDWWVIKIDSQGNKEWDQHYGTVQTEFSSTIITTSDGGYLIGGFSEGGISGDKTQPSQGGTDYWIVKTDALGNKQWDKRYGGAARDDLQSMIQTADGGYLLAGESESMVGGDKTEPTYGMSDMWLVKIDAVGNVIWDHDLGSTSNEELHVVLQDQQGNYLISGDSYSPIGGDKSENNLGVEQSWILKVDTVGNKIWDKTILSHGHDETTHMVVANTGCYTVANCTDGVVGGYQTNPARGLLDYWMVKFCDSTLAVGINTPDSEIEAIYPNPFSDKLTISFNKSIKNCNVKISNILGQTVYKRKLEETANTSEVMFDLSDLSNGAYFLQVDSAAFTKTYKLIKQ